MASRKRITEQDDRFLENKAKAENDPAGMQALTIIYLEDLADNTDEIKEQFVVHCKQPAERAHPRSAAAHSPGPGAGPYAGMTPKQRYKLMVMENRGKIIAAITASISAVLVVAFHGVGY